jgi:inner membrane transporter RhtA
VAVPDREAPQAVAPAVGLVLAAVTSLQFGAALGVTLFDRTGAAGTALVRVALAALVLLVVVRPRLRGRTRADWWTIAGFGACLGTMNLGIYEALDRIPLGAAVTIEFIGPLGLAAALSRRRIDLLWVGLAALGVLLLANPAGATSDLVGVGFALLAGAAWAAYIVLAQRAGRTWRGADGVAVAMAFAVLVPLVPGVAGGGGALLSTHVLLVGLAVAIASSVLPYTLETEALRRLPASVFGVLMSIEPAVAALAGLVVLGQGLSAVDLAAIGCVVVASAGASRSPVAVAEA